MIFYYSPTLELTRGIQHTTHLFYLAFQKPADGDLSTIGDNACHNKNMLFREP